MKLEGAVLTRSIHRNRFANVGLQALSKIGVVSTSDIATEVTRHEVRVCLCCHAPSIVTADRTARKTITLPAGTRLNKDGRVAPSELEKLGLFYNRRLGGWSNNPL